MRSIFEIMISPDHVLCDIPRILDNCSEPKLKILENIPHILELKTIYIVFSKILKNTRYTFQNWRQIMTLVGVLHVLKM